MIRRVVVEGNQRIEPSTVESYLALRPGDVYDPQKVDNSIKSLYATGLFDDVAIQRQDDVLLVKVVENPIINRIAFEGNKRLETKVLESEIQLRPRVVYTRARVQNAVSRILELYRRNGRYAAKVEPKIIELDQNRVDLVFEIDEGPVTGVGGISFIGNEQFSDSTLRGVIADQGERLVSLLRHVGYLRSGPAELRPGAAAAVLQRARLCRLPGRLGDRRADARRQGVLHHLHRRGGPPVQVRRDQGRDDAEGSRHRAIDSAGPVAEG